MSSLFILFPVFFPILSGAILPLVHIKETKKRNCYVAFTTILNSIVLILVLYFFRSKGNFVLLNMAGKLAISFHVDGLSCVFGCLLAVLWPLSVFYAFEYMKKEGKENTFYSFYTMTFGISTGIAFAGNLMTLYLFYELLTFVTLPLVMHGMSKKAIFAGRRYVNYSVGGAAFAFIGIAFVMTFGDSIDFIYGGVLNGDYTRLQTTMLQIAFVFTTFGFGVKAAMVPFHHWLPTVSVAPTPVTALLHAVAVVKAGAFAIIRIIYYSFGADLVKGTVFQYIILCASIFTILFGSTMALKEQHFKRRLAYSTISNLSYIVFGAALMSPEGMTGAMTHILAHGVTKITLFFCAGAVLCKTGLEYVHDLRGIGRRMPVTFFCFTIGSISLIGVPPFGGFISKWNLAKAAVSEGSVFSMIGLAAILISSVLTAIYLFLVVFIAYSPTTKTEVIDKHYKESACMTVPMLVLSLMMLLTGLFGGQLTDVLISISKGGVL